MTPERWQMVRGILQSAMELRPAERDAFLNRECASDPSLRKDVDEMLSVQGKLDKDFLESPAAAQVEFPGQSFTTASTLAAGTRLGNYEIRALLGAGGMGQVYRARDLLLKRDVAIKVIPNFYASDPARMHRFRQEAEATAALSHPNILTVYQVGEHEGTFYIVAELLQGDTLRDRLRAGPLPLRYATDFGVQIARGLSAAHERGIVHRDLKPENIFVTKDGRIKILDFGLAKLTEHQADPQESHEKTKPTATQWTEPGLVLGTTAYMSPEQVRGNRVDHRSDIFAFGAVLYEMLTGRLAFAKGTSAETMTAILNDDPPALSQSGQNVPPGMQRVIQRCLEKQPEQRFQSASDLAFALEALSDSGTYPSKGPVPAASSRRSWLVPAVIAVVVLAVPIYFWWRLPPAVPVVESVTQLTNDGEPKSGGFTDGMRVYFSEGDLGAKKLAQVSVSGGGIAPIESIVANLSVRSVARDGSALLVTDAGANLWSLPLPVGEPRRIVSKDFLDASFFPDGRIAYSLIKKDDRSDLVLADKDGQNARTIGSFDGFIGVNVSPDGNQILLEESDFKQRTLRVKIIGSDGTNLREVLKVGGIYQKCCFNWSQDQRYLFYTDRLGGRSDIWALPIKPDPFRRSSSPIRLTAGPLSYDVPFPSPDGRRLFTVGTRGKAELVRYDIHSRQITPHLSGISALEPSYSRDGRWVVYISYPDLILWRSRADGTERTQLTYPPMEVHWPFLSPDGRKVVFRSLDDTYIVDAEGGPPHKIIDQATSANWSPDGAKLVYATDNSNVRILRIFDLNTNETVELPSSMGKAGPWWIDANTIVALDYLQNKFMTFDLNRREWRDLAPATAINWCPSFDRMYLYFTTTGKELLVKRVRFADHETETIGTLKNLRQATNTANGYTQMSIAPDGSLLFSRDLSSQEIYALNMRWP